MCGESLDGIINGTNTQARSAAERRGNSLDNFQMKDIWPFSKWPNLDPDSGRDWLIFPFSLAETQVESGAVSKQKVEPLLTLGNSGIPSMLRVRKDRLDGINTHFKDLNLEAKAKIWP